MDPTLISRCEGEDDPNRCQSVAGKGQCTNKAVEGGTYCMIHGGHHTKIKNEQTALKNYRLTKFRARTERMASSTGIKSLRDEIAILRMMLEERLEQTEDATDLILNSGPIADLIMKIERLVTSCNILEGKMGQLLDKQAVINFATEVVELISAKVDNEEILEEIATGIAKILERQEDESA